MTLVLTDNEKLQLIDNGIDVFKTSIDGEITSQLQNIINVYKAMQMVQLVGESSTGPSADPGWEDSSTLDMTNPDRYINIDIEGKTYVVPAWEQKI
jgi:hypothetical protein